MQSMPDDLFLLQQQVEVAKQSNDILSVLQKIRPFLIENRDSQETYRLLVDSFTALQILTSRNEQEGEQFILEHLLGYLEQDSQGTAIQKNATRLLRECLEEWIAQYSEPQSSVLRQHILNDLLHRFQERPSCALCWTFSHLGYRDEHIVDALWKYALENNGETSDTALATLTALGVLSSERSRLLAELHRRMASNVTQPLLLALHRLADPSSFEVMCNTYFSSSYSERPKDFLLGFGILAHIADTHDKDEGLQDTIWEFIAAQYEQPSPEAAYAVNFGSSIISLCDSMDTVPTMLTWLGQATDEEKQRQRNPLLLYRLEECIRPRQLASWQQETTPPLALPVLRESACQDTQYAGRSVTQEMHRKEAAWKTLFHMGYAESLEWFEDAVIKETNPYFRGELCDMFACFRLEHLSNVFGSITELYEAKDSHGQVAAEIHVHLGIIQIAQSAASQQAFEALLDCGLTLDGQPLRASVDALAVVAGALAREGHLISIVEHLVKTIVSHARPANRLAAARALEVLAEEQALPPHLLQPLLDILLRQQDRDPFERSILLAAFASQQDIPEDLLFSLKQWALERNDRLALQAFSMLAENGLLLPEAALLKRLGLSEDDQAGTEPSLLSRSEWRTHVIGLLYLRDPEMFASRIGQLLKTLPWVSVIQLFGKLRAVQNNPVQQPFQQEIVSALLDRMRQRQLRTEAELGLIGWAAKLIPEQFAQEAWDRIWENWLSSARTILAESLGTLPEISEKAHENRVRLLQLLTSDGDYPVRRAAYQALQRSAEQHLLQWCETWAQSTVRSLRLRAAEACAWLSPEGEYGEAYETFFTLLATDCEPVIRETAQRTWQERRKRLWAQWYLTKVTERSHLTNKDVFSVWPYAEAFKRVGDDNTLQVLRRRLQNQELLPNVRHWYNLLLKETNEGWEKAIKKWPQPGNTWKGFLGEGDGLLYVAQHSPRPVHYVVWLDASEDVKDVSGWGGTLKNAPFSSVFATRPCFLRLADGSLGKILIKEASMSERFAVFFGQGPYPVHEANLMRNLSPEQFKSLVRDLLQSLGYSVEITSGREHGYDYLLSHSLMKSDDSMSKQRWFVEVKHEHREDKLGVNVVRQFYTLLRVHQPNNALLLITNAQLTSQAKRFVAQHDELDVWDVNKLLILLRQSSEQGNNIWERYSG